MSASPYDTLLQPERSHGLPSSAMATGSAHSLAAMVTPLAAGGSPSLVPSAQVGPTPAVPFPYASSEGTRPLAIDPPTGISMPLSSPSLADGPPEAPCSGAVPTIVAHPPHGVFTDPAPSTGRQRSLHVHMQTLVKGPPSPCAAVDRAPRLTSSSSNLHSRHLDATSVGIDGTLGKSDTLFLANATPPSSNIAALPPLLCDAPIAG